LSSEVGLRLAWKKERTKTNHFRALEVMAAAVLAASLLMLTDLPGRSARAQTSTLEATLVGAGDIASCSFDRDSVTTRLLAKVPGTVFTLGDNVYPDGTLGQFRECYHPTWGQRRPAPSPR
jgi:acid phosphatase type 7